MSTVSTLSSKFNLAVPKEVRSSPYRNWKAGQKFTFVLKKSGVLLVPVPDTQTPKETDPEVIPEGNRVLTDSD